jgi:multimeric flavodoxin WrbA
MRYYAINCTLKPTPAESSTDVLLGHVTGMLEARGVTGTTQRIVDANVSFGVTSDEGSGDGWPAIRSEILESDILVFGTPIWLGHPASVTQMVLERMDAFLGETDDEGRMITTGRIAIVAVVGNEDGAHHVGAELFQGLNDVGFTIPAGGMTYWVGEAMHKTDFKDVKPAPEKAISTAHTMVANAVHLAGILSRDEYPAPEKSD